MSPSRRTGKEPVLWRCAQRDARWSAGCQATHRGGEPLRAMRCGGASREARRPSIAPYRHAARRVRTRGTRGVGSRRDASVERATGADHWGRGGTRAWSAQRGRTTGTARVRGRVERAPKGREGAAWERGVGASKEKPKRVTMRTRVRHSLVLRFSGLRKAALPKVGIFDRMGKSIYSNL